MMQSSNGLNDSMIFSLLDSSWYRQSILSQSMASCVPSIEPETVLRSSEVDNKSGSEWVSAKATSTSQFIDEDHHAHSQKNRGKTRRYAVDESELRRVFDKFDDDADGLISVEEIGRHMRCCYGKEMSDEEANAMVSSVDRNSDGAVDFEDFLALYQKSRRSSSDYVTEEDARQDEEDIKDTLLQTFRLFDKNQDGFITAQELQAVLLSLGIPEGKNLIDCDKMIRNFDLDGDGQCDFREFQEMMSAHTL